MYTSKLTNARGNTVANHTVIHTDKGDFLQSYSSIVAQIKRGEVTLDEYYWDYSATTLKYLKRFLGTTVSKKVMQQRIKDGEYKTANLQSSC